MAAKKVWMSWLLGDDVPHQPSQYGGLLSTYGLEVAGSKWVDDIPRVGWLEGNTDLLDASQTDLWLIVGDASTFNTPSLRYGLSLLTATVHAERGESFPIVCLGVDAMPEPLGLPTLLRPSQCLTATDQSWPAKVVAAGFRPPHVPRLDFRLSIHAHPMLGQWFEVGPQDENWAGVMFGVSEGGTITHHAVGPKGVLPERTVLEYQMQGIQVDVGGTAFTAWAVQNTLGPDDSYYIKVDDAPASIIVAGHPGTDQAEAFVLELQ